MSQAGENNEYIGKPFAIERKKHSLRFCFASIDFSSKTKKECLGEHASRALQTSHLPAHARSHDIFWPLV